MRFPITFGLATWALVSVTGTAIAAEPSPRRALPVVDLGYALHQASSFDEQGGFYNFSNIRYAAPPVGDLRFRAPSPPVTDRGAVGSGLEPRICPQSPPQWLALGHPWLVSYLGGGPLPNDTFLEPEFPVNVSALRARDPRETEDCLFLDVKVPAGVFEEAGSGNPGAPVIVYIHGGGYYQGSKEEVEPQALLHRSLEVAESGVIFVALNYRFGAFGFLAGTEVLSDGTLNAGLHDQRFALQWVQDNIHLFGGDPKRVTVNGGSAGGGSIIHQITAFGGRRGTPFQQAMPQSPAWWPSEPRRNQDKVYEDLLALAHVESLEQLRQAPSDVLILANAVQNGRWHYGNGPYGPTIDGSFVLDDPRTLLLKGQFSGVSSILATYNRNEGAGAAPPVASDEGYAQWLRRLLTDASPATIDYLVSELYQLDDSTADIRRAQVDRASLTAAEGIFLCGASALAQAFVAAGLSSYGFLFSVGFGSGHHGAEHPFTYHAINEAPANETIGNVLKDYLLNFAVSGAPTTNVPGALSPPPYGEEKSIIDLRDGSIERVRDIAANVRCEWWNTRRYRTCSR